ncbi:MAG: hypothetical protein A2W91_16800 [Bacteroidetes bacterium GWF2_38_335]|nr:MAG: hypothetical protein A2W91_16800 [Bacteroidetes bacterium GWF2_38_335]OFY81344.1 MAG: hypothetical protein A2281_07775 [Bacteroidetes bacterium RIFOXYA12_FULL_38_20]HBS85466.1 hypothetical protein [Bacteroidales bacterium]
MSKITYLFGAGASFGAVPVVEQIPKSLREFSNIISNAQYLLSDLEKYDGNSKPTKREVQKSFKDDIDWLEKESGKHSSIDTFAKKLLVTQKHQAYKKLKCILSLFFIYEQAKNSTNPRYDSFIASIISNSGRMSPRIRVISWNYDYQFEKAYCDYSGKDDIFSNQNLLNVIPKEINLLSKADDEDSFSIFKINGTTGFKTIDKIQNPIDNLKQKIKRDFIDSLVRTYFYSTNFDGYLTPTLSFAWEKEELNEKTKGAILTSTKDTIALVIIGYSMPVFNREIDREIIGNMSDLKTVYFQAPGDVPKQYKSRFKAIRSDISDSNLIEVNDVEQFFMPNEL